MKRALLVLVIFLLPICTLATVPRDRNNVTDSPQRLDTTPQTQSIASVADPVTVVNWPFDEDGNMRTTPYVGQRAFTVLTEPVTVNNLGWWKGESFPTDNFGVLYFIPVVDQECPAPPFCVVEQQFTNGFPWRQTVCPYGNGSVCTATGGRDPDMPSAPGIAPVQGRRMRFSCTGPSEGCNIVQIYAYFRTN